jgi:translation initiation factor 4E
MGSVKSKDEKSAKESSVAGSLRSKASSNSLAVSSLASTKSKDAETPLSVPIVHPLRDTWVFWNRPPITKSNTSVDYEKTLTPMMRVSTVGDFFLAYGHLKRPSTLPLVSDYHFFKEGIRPIWEDDENKHGGKWIVRLKKGVADRYWEDLLFAMIGDEFGDASEEVCGAVLSVRNGEDILSIWTRTEGSKVLKIR